jgi:4-amino-4-deoxy-L-arabinose transferase-like glycosyltransferase
MKRFIAILTFIGFSSFVVGTTINLLHFDLHRLTNLITSDGTLDRFAEYIIASIGTGLMLATLPLLALASLLFLAQKGIIGLFRWPLKYFLICLLAVQMILGFSYIFTAHYEVEGDAVWYNAQAINLASGNGVITNRGQPTAFWPAGYSFLLAPFYRLFGPDVHIGEILNVLFQAGLLLVTYLTARRLFNDRVARKSTLILALMPSQIFYSLLLMADIPFTFIFSIVLYLVSSKSSYRNTLIIGILFGVAMFLRPILLFFPILIGIYLYQRDRNMRTVLTHLAIILVVGEAILLPWQIRNYRIFGDFVLVSNNGGYNLWMGNNPLATGGSIEEYSYVSKDTLASMKRELNELELDRYSTSRAIAFMKTYPVKTITLWAKKFVHLFYKDSKCITYGFRWNFEQLPPTILMTMVAITEGYYYSLGLAFLLALLPFIRREKISLRFLLLSGTIVYFIIIYMPFISDGRFHLPLLPLFAIIVAQYGEIDTSLSASSKPATPAKF